MKFGLLLAPLLTSGAESFVPVATASANRTGNTPSIAYSDAPSSTKQPTTPFPSTNITRATTSTAPSGAPTIFSVIPSSDPYEDYSTVEYVSTPAFSIIFNSSNTTNLSESDYRRKVAYTAENHFQEFLEVEYAERYPDKFVSIELFLDRMSDGKDNVAFTRATLSFDVCRPSASECYISPPSPDDILLDLQNRVKTHEFLESMLSLSSTSFKDVSSVVLKPESNLVKHPPTAQCVKALQIELDEPLMVNMNQTTAEATMLCERSGLYAGDYYKSAWVKVAGTGGVFKASTCGSNVDARMSLYSTCTNTQACLEFLDSDSDPYDYDGFCDEHCLETSTTSCNGTSGSELTWQSEEEKSYYIQVWQNRRSWGLWHQRFYYPLPCDGVAKLVVTSSDIVNVGVTESSFQNSTIPSSVVKPGPRALASLDKVWRFPYNGHDFVEPGEILLASTQEPPAIIYSEQNDFCHVDFEAALPGTWFGISSTKGDLVVCLQNDRVDISNNATISVVGGLYRYYKGDVESLDGCVPSALAYEDASCAVAVKFRATSIHAVFVQSSTPLSFNISVSKAPGECAATPQSSLTTTVQPNTTLSARPTLPPVGSLSESPSTASAARPTAAPLPAMTAGPTLSPVASSRVEVFSDSKTLPTSDGHTAQAVESLLFLAVLFTCNIFVG